MPNPLSATLSKLSRRVINERDTDEQKLQKTLLIFACGLMGFAAMLWLVIYHAMGIRYSATVPLIYLGVSAATPSSASCSGTTWFASSVTASTTRYCAT